MSLETPKGGRSVAASSSNTSSVGNGNDQAHETLLQFDLSSIPWGPGIVSATLGLDVWKASAASTVDAYFVTSPWTQSTTWNTFGGPAGELARQTEDPTVLGDALERQTLDETAAAALPNAQALTRAVGRRIAAEPHTMVARRTPGDILLLCTDGVPDLLHTGAMRKTLITSANLGGRDAATAVAARNVA
jgi:hypothetical protein